VYTYDAIGSYERVGYGCQGSGKELIQPVLDNQLKAASPLVLPQQVGGGGQQGGRAAGLVMLAGLGGWQPWYGPEQQRAEDFAGHSILHAAASYAPAPAPISSC
jgi:hypothetical protein